jgi:hypothetical protein
MTSPESEQPTGYQNPGPYQPFPPPDRFAPIAAPGYRDAPGYHVPVGGEDLTGHQVPAGYPATPAYQNPGFTPTSGQRNGIGIAALTLGVASIPTACCFGVGGVFGIAAVVFGAIGVRRAGQGLASNRDQAIAGLICGSVGVLFSIAFWAMITLPRSPADLFN